MNEVAAPARWAAPSAPSLRIGLAPSLRIGLAREGAVSSEPDAEVPNPFDPPAAASFARPPSSVSIGQSRPGAGSAGADAPAQLSVGMRVLARWIGGGMDLGGGRGELYPGVVRAIRGKGDRRRIDVAFDDGGYRQ